MILYLLSATRRKGFQISQSRYTFAGNQTQQCHSLARSSVSSYLFIRSARNPLPSAPVVVQQDELLESWKTCTPFSLQFASPHFLQVRWKRRDGNKAFSKIRPPTKKQRKAYNRKLQAKQEKEARHGAPGFKAGPRREWVQNMKEDLLENGVGGDPTKNDPSLLEYGVEDALLDDLIGNTKGLTSQPTPHPIYIGHKYETYDQRLRQQLEDYTNQQLLITSQSTASAHQAQEGAGESRTSVPMINSKCPSDRSIALALRSYRDRDGTRNRPIGIVKALEYLLQDVGLKISSFGELSYTALLTCCRTPAEARRIIQMMKREQHPVSPYSWSILVDVYSKVGDYTGAAEVMQEMVSEGVPPTLAAYTSFLAACYKVCNDGRIAHAVRASCGELALKKWQEMRVVGVDPDAMAYGAMLRICAARGHPERALNILEEMHSMGVKPTTLCFSSALRAVAKSHATAIRYERGSSKKNRRREFLTQHHGKMARSIVIMAENAEVEQDAGFVSALILCAAAAGDAATAKAVYVASQIRSLDHLRTIGSESHLARLRRRSSSSPGQNSQLVFADEPSQQLIDWQQGELDEEHQNSVPTAEVGSERSMHDNSRVLRNPQTSLSFEEREYGKDSRVLSAILHACAQAVDQNSIGTMWSGRENDGYLCENSLRLLTARRQPRYFDNTIPGQTRTADLTWDEEHRDPDYRDGKRKPRKFAGVRVSEDGASTLDELSDDFARMFVDEEGQRREEHRSTTPEDIWRMKYGDHDYYIDDKTTTPSTKMIEKDEEQINAIESQSNPYVAVEETANAHEELFFDYDTMRWQTRRKSEAKTSIANTDILSKITSQDDVKIERNHDRDFVSSNAEGEDEFYFDEDLMRWTTRPKAKDQTTLAHTEYESSVLISEAGKKSEESLDSEDIDIDEFNAFFSELKCEVGESADFDEHVSEEEARELFLMMKAEFNEVMCMDVEDLMSLSDSDLPDEVSSFDAEAKPPNSFVDAGISETQRMESKTNRSFQRKDKGKTLEQKNDIVDREPNVIFSSFRQPGNNQLDFLLERASQTTNNNELSSLLAEAARVATLDPPIHSEQQDISKKSLPVLPSTNAEVYDEQNSSEKIEESDLDLAVVADDELDELREILPGLPEKRLQKIIRIFRKSLGEPPLLELIPIVRERMPDYLTATWLKQMSLLTARYVVQKAKEEGVIDHHLLNNVLELETQSGSLDRAVEFYELAFKENCVSPTDYSNRLILQMFLRGNRLSRALSFREKLKEDGNKLDIPSYGSLIGYCARHHQIGSSMLLLKECLAVHGSPPGESSLKELRFLCRKAGLHSELTTMVGQDPIEWLRDGEVNLKREMSKKGRRDVLLPRNWLVHL